MLVMLDHEVNYRPSDAGTRRRRAARIGGEVRILVRFGAPKVLGHAVPVGDGWVDWREADHDQLRARLDWPVDGIIFDIRNNDFPHRGVPPPQTTQSLNALHATNSMTC